MEEQGEDGTFNGLENYTVGPCIPGVKDPDIKRARQLAEDARHESVTPERLTETERGMGRRRLHDDPVYRYIRNGEQPEFLFHADKQTPAFNGPGAPEAIERSRRYQVLHLITDSRWVMLAGNNGGDQTQVVSLADIEATNYDTSGSISDTLSNNTFVIELPSVHVTIPLSNEYDEADLEALSKYLRDEFGAVRGEVPVDSDEAGYTIAGSDSIQYDASDVRSRINRLPESALDEADELTSAADSVEELIPRLDALLEEYEEEPQTLDDIVADASSIDEVRRSVETPQERATRQAKELAEGQLETARTVLQDADREEIGQWGINIGRASAPLAAAAPGSTPLWIAAALALGGAAGAHSSGVEGSPLQEIDPSELADHVLAMADAGRELDEIDGEIAGTLLGAFTYLGGQLAPEEFVTWIEAADTDAVLAGANAGAAYAKRSDIEGTQLQGALAGGGLGLLGGYAGLELGDEAATEDAAAEIERYLTALSEEGVALEDDSV
jgi:hypothetical protein